MDSPVINSTLVVSNLPHDCTYQLINESFIPFGDIKEIEYDVDPISNVFRGYAFVEFEDEEDADQAVFNMHNSELNGNIIKVEKAKARRTKEQMSKPIWADAKYFEKYGEKTYT